MPSRAVRRLARRAAHDPRALERLVRLAYRHAARYYLEVARTPAIAGAELPKRLVVETPETVEDAFRPGRPAIFVGLHFGAIELPALFLASRVGEAVGPWRRSTTPSSRPGSSGQRGAAGIRIVGLRRPAVN